MLLSPSPEEDESPSDPSTVDGLSSSHTQMSIYELIDECANALGIWGKEHNTPVKHPGRRHRG